MTRRIHILTALLAIIFAAGPAGAQDTTFTAPIYNSGNGPTYYTAQPGTNAVPNYNNASNAPALPMQQMIAGRNAPSYNFNSNQVQPYTFNSGSNVMSGVTSIGSLSPEQASYLRAQQAQQAQMQQQQAMNGSQYSVFGGQPQMGAGQYGATTYQPQMQPGTQGQQQPVQQIMNNSPFGTQRTDQPVKRRVVYKERNNPLVTPQRLFNPDQ